MLTDIAAFGGLIVKTDGANDATFTIYDSTTASGTLLAPESFAVPGTAGLWTFSVDPPLRAANGIYVDLACAGNVWYMVLYDRG